jgi:hypothetical protein
MDRAINKSTEKLISAFEVYKNGSYQNLDRGEWIAPKDSIYNWEEIVEEDAQVHYVSEKMLQRLNYPTTFGLCPKCKSGYMTKKDGRFGLFYGCSNYPICKHIINIKGEGDDKII